MGCERPWLASGTAAACRLNAEAGRQKQADSDEGLFDPDTVELRSDRRPKRHRSVSRHVCEENSVNVAV